MDRILKGAPVAKDILALAKADAEKLIQSGTAPTLAIVRVGERPDDIAYENSLIKRCESNSVAVKTIALEQTATTETLVETLEKINNDGGIHGCLLFRPLPSHIDETKVRNSLCAKKDVDGISDLSLAGVFTDSSVGYCPCTALASVEILKHYNIELSGKHAVVLGRSLVVGKPLSMLLLKENSTVTICHTKTKDVASETAKADILFACAGRARMVKENFVKPSAVVVDVGINFDESGMCGDVDFDKVSEKTAAITPVPGGIGAVTTAIMIRNVVDATKKQTAN